MKNKHTLFTTLILFLFLISLIGNIYQYKLSKENEEKTKLELHHIKIKVQECMKKENYTISGMSECVDDSIYDWDKEIKENIKNSKAYLTPKEFDLLLDNQKKWEIYRESQFALIKETYYNTKALIYLNYASGDRAGVVEKRAKDLSWFVHIMQTR